MCVTTFGNSVLDRFFVVVFNVLICNNSVTSSPARSNYISSNWALSNFKCFNLRLVTFFIVLLERIVSSNGYHCGWMSCGRPSGKWHCDNDGRVWVTQFSSFLSEWLEVVAMFHKAFSQHLVGSIHDAFTKPKCLSLHQQCSEFFWVLRTLS